MTEPLDFEVVNDGNAGIYAAIAGDREVAGLTYDLAGENRIVLRATSVFPEFRKQGIATELIRRVLDDIRAQGRTVTTMCPIVHTFITNNPDYADLVDPRHPGLANGRYSDESDRGDGPRSGYGGNDAGGTARPGRGAARQP
jgi:predicted GNAT family acetyltransferase